jgi:tRNA(Arg) A34 adenosine deaminase TadA
MAGVDQRAASSFAALANPMQRAIDAALDAVRAGSLGIGAVVARPDGSIVANGRNRLHETEPGDDLIAGSSLAHAEINALGKLRFREHEQDDLELYTTLQPCLQCLGAIRLSPVRAVHILAPDPLWIGVEQLRHVTAHVGLRWPAIRTLAASEWSVLALISPTRHALAHPVIGGPWRRELPETSELAASIDPATLSGGRAADTANAHWADLSSCVDEVERLAERARVSQA